MTSTAEQAAEVLTRLADAIESGDLDAPGAMLDVLRGATFGVTAMADRQ